MICIESPKPHQNYKLRFVSLDIYTLTKSRLEDRDKIIFLLLKLLCINILTITIKSDVPRGEIGRHKGLKILALWECQFESWPRAPHQL